MSTYAQVHDAGAFVNAVIGVEPQDPGGAATLNGGGHDRLDNMSAVAHFVVGTTAGGGPDVTVRIEHSPDNATWTELPDVNGNTGVNSTSFTGSTGGAVEQELDVDLRHADQWIRAVIDVTAANGATAVPVAASLVLAGVAQAELPV
jgi:hypothetical protein